jgi:hypothetical protein
MFGGEVVGQHSLKDYKTFFGPQVDLALLGTTAPALVAQLAARSPVTNGISGDIHSWSPFAEVSYNIGSLEVTASARDDNIKQHAGSGQLSREIAGGCPRAPFTSSG